MRPATVSQGFKASTNISIALAPPPPPRPTTHHTPANHPPPPAHHPPPGIPTATTVTAVDAAAKLITLSAKTTAAIGTFDVNTVGVALGPLTSLTGTSTSFGNYVQQTTAGAPTTVGTKTVSMSANVIVTKGMTVSSGTAGELETWTTVAEDSTGSTVKLSDAVKVQMTANTQLTFSTKKVVLSADTNVKVGQVVTGTGIDTSGGGAGTGGGTRVASITGNVITLDKDLTADLSATALTFSTFTIELEHDADLIGVRITGSSTQAVSGTGIASGTTVTQVNGKVIRLSNAIEAGGNNGIAADKLTFQESNNAVRFTDQLRKN